MQSDITDLTAIELSEAIRTRQVRCIDVMEAYLNRIHRYNPRYNAIVGLRDDDVLFEEAAAADLALQNGEYWGWMHGMPHAVKDLADAKGLVTTYGSPLFAENKAQQDSLPVARMRAQGAIFIGKTNVPEFGLGSNTYNAVYGVTGNAYDPSLSAGGSSGGAATAIALHLTPCADGSDMMGSLRNPAAFNNVVGFRPSQGRVPSPSAETEVFYNQLPTDGPMGRNVADTIQLLTTMAGYDARSPLALRDDLPEAGAFRLRPLEGLKIGWMADYRGYLSMEDGILDVCQAALGILSQQGANVEDCVPNFDMARLWEVWLTLRQWSMSDLKPLYDNEMARPLVKPEAIWEIESGLGMTAAEVSHAGKGRSAWFRALLELFETYDVLALPSAQVFPFAAETSWPKSVNGIAMDTYHRWMEVVIGGTLAGLPVISLPAGFGPKDRPMGIQFMGPPGADQKVLEFALAYEAATSLLDRRPVLQEA
ncbi:MAG: amidase [Pseudomonadota bacterium]